MGTCIAMPTKNDLIITKTEENGNLKNNRSELINRDTGNMHQDETALVGSTYPGVFLFVSST